MLRITNETELRLNHSGDVLATIAGDYDIELISEEQEFATFYFVEKDEEPDCANCRFNEIEDCGHGCRDANPSVYRVVIAKAAITEMFKQISK